MKTITIFRAAAFCSLLAAGLAACTAEDSSLAGGDALPVSGDSSIQSVTMMARDFLREDGSHFAPDDSNGSSAMAGSDLTRTSVTINTDPVNGGAIFKWTEGDMVGVLPKEGEQTGFAIKEGVGSNMAMFDGGSWALRPMADYAAYYPYHKSVDFGRKAVPVTYPLELTQNGNASTAHLAPTDFMAARATTPQTGNVVFNFEHLGALVMLNLPITTPGEVKQVVLEGSSPWYATAATADLTVDKPELKVTEWGEKLVLNLTGVTTSGEGEKVTVLFMLAPTTLAANQVKVTAGSYVGYLPAKSLRAGKLYLMEARKRLPEGCADLGLSVFWADHNVGAATPEEYGDYFSWGETASKSAYNSSVLNGQDVGIISGRVQYDAATANWGEPWRTPTVAEYDELINKCVWTWTSQGGKDGYLVRGSGFYSDCSIFFAAAGLRDTEGAPVEAGTFGYYWSATPISNIHNYAIGLNFDRSFFAYNWFERYTGFVVRPVQNK